MLEPEQILHAVMILEVESENERNDDLILKVQQILGCDDSDYDAAMEHIEEHRDNGNWGGRSEAVLNRSRDRIREAIENETLPSSGDVGDQLMEIIEEEGGEIDPFAELGVSSSSNSISGSTTNIANNDPLAAFMDDDEEDESFIDESGFFNESSNSEEDGQNDNIDEEEHEEEHEEEYEEEHEQNIESNEAYEMLMSTCWIDGILDPAEAKLLARKREELGISFEEHLTMLRNMLGKF